MSQKFLILSKYTIKRRKMNQNKVLSRLLNKKNHYNSWIMKFNSKLKVIRFKCKIIGVREIPLIKFFCKLKKNYNRNKSKTGMGLDNLNSKKKINLIILQCKTLKKKKINKLFWKIKKKRKLMLFKLYQCNRNLLKRNLCKIIRIRMIILIYLIKIIIF